MGERKIKKELRETLQEYDLLYDTEEEWKNMRDAVQKALNTGLNDIEEDNYDDGRQKLKFVIDTLNKWDEILDFEHAGQEGGMDTFTSRHPNPRFK